MNAKEVINIIRNAAEYAKNKGLETVFISNLENLLNDIEKEYSKDIQVSEQPDGGVTSIQFKAQHESSLAEYKATVDVFLENFRSVIQLGQSSLKSAILINGGGAVALLAFLGHIWNTQPSGLIVSALPISLFIFSVGVFFAGAACGTTYLAQSYFKDGTNIPQLAHIYNKISIALVIFSLGCFIGACSLMFCTFIKHFKH